MGGLRLLKLINISSVYCVFFVILAAFSLFSPSVSALSTKQKKIIDSGIYYFDVESSATCRAGTNSATSTLASINLDSIARKYKLHSASVKELGGPVIDTFKAGESPPAVSSVLKIIIADVYLSQEPNLKKIITIKASQLYQVGSTNDFAAGQKVSMSEVLQKTLAESSNTGANVLIDEVGGHSDATSKAHKLGYSDKTRIRSNYNDQGSNTPNETTVADLTKAMDKIFTQTSSSYMSAQDALKQSKKKWGLNSDANKWGGNSQITGNSGLFNGINSKNYIITSYIGLDWEGDTDAKTASGPIAIKNSTNEILAALQSGGSQPVPPGSSVCCAVGSVNLVGSEYAEKIWNYLVNIMGFTPIQAAGIMGNIQQESGFSPTALNPDSGAYGIVQWYAGRRTALENYATSKAVDKSDLGLQLEFLSKELNSDYKATVLDPIKASDSLEEVTRIWLERFEIPCIPGSSGCAEEMKKRVPFAVVMLAKYGSSSGGTSSSSDSTSCGEDSSGEVIGDFSLPLPKKWYASNKEWFTKDHHDYPAADIPVPEGTPVYSMTAGKIISAPNEGGFGRGVTIDAGNGVQFIYGHGTDGGTLQGAKQGDTVSAGQLIMHSGNTGQSTGPHLHLELLINGTRHCPQLLFVGIAEGNIPQLSSLATSGCEN